MASKHPIKPQLEFKVEGIKIQYKHPNSPYWNIALGPTWGTNFVCSCCGLREVAYWRDSIEIPPIPPEIMDDWFERIVKARKGNPEYIGVITNSQCKKGDFYYAIGLPRFFIGKPTPNTVHGPALLQLMRINVSDWYGWWVKSIRRRYVTWYNKEVKKW